MELSDGLALFTFVALIGGGIVILFVVLENLTKGREVGTIRFEGALTPKQEIIEGYRLRSRLFTQSEAAFFYALVQVLPPEHHIFPKMRVADIVETLKGEGYTHRRNRVLPKHIDFVVCDKNFRPLLAIEIDGTSHRNEEVLERDRLKDAIFRGVGTPLERVTVGADFMTEARRLVNLL